MKETSKNSLLLKELKFPLIHPIISSWKKVEWKKWKDLDREMESRFEQGKELNMPIVISNIVMA